MRDTAINKLSYKTGGLRAFILTSLIYQIINVVYYALILVGIAENDMINREWVEFAIDTTAKGVLLYGLWRHKAWAWYLSITYLFLSFIYIIGSMFSNPSYESPEIYIGFVAFVYGWVILYLNNRTIRTVLSTSDSRSILIPYIYNLLFSASVFFLCTYSIGYVLSIVISVFVFVTLSRLAKKNRVIIQEL